MGMITPVRQSFAALPEQQATLAADEATRSSRWSYSCIEQLQLHLGVRLAFRELWEQGPYAVRKGLS